MKGWAEVSQTCTFCVWPLLHFYNIDLKKILGVRCSPLPPGVRVAISTHPAGRASLTADPLMKELHLLID